jgi:hypothetical protein
MTREYFYKLSICRSGLCNQLYFLFSSIIDSIKKNNSELKIVDEFLLDINANNYCKINEIVDVNYLNSILEKYNVKIIEHNINSLKIISVFYSDDYDITSDFSSKFLKNDSIIVKSRTNLNRIFGDPKPFVKKELKIKYILDNEIKELVEPERNGLLINDINIIGNNSVIEYNYSDWRLLFMNYDNLEFQYFIIKNFKFSDTIIDKALTFLQNNNINIHEKLNCLHLRIEDDCIHHWSKLSNLDFNDYKFKLESKFINLIETYFDKDVPILLLSYDINNKVTDYLKNNDYIYYIKEDKEPNKREYNAAIDLQIGLFCNNIFIGCENSTFSQIIHKKIENKTSILINLENVDCEDIIIIREY